MDTPMDRLNDADRLAGWIPLRFYWEAGQGMVDWCYLGRNRFQDSFFEQTIGECVRSPFSLLFRHQTPIEVLGELCEARPGIRPNGFIFHLSRCGSTLTSQMFAALPQTIVISEARPIDSTLRAARCNGNATPAQRVDWLRWVISALGAQRRGDERHFFVKFDTWNVLELPLIREAFPDVPWIFIYRDPVEVMVSQMNHRGAHMVPGAIDPGVFGFQLASLASMAPEEYCARVLAAICKAGLDQPKDRGMLVNYRQLPDAVIDSIAGFFGLELTPEHQESMNRVTRLHAKNRAEGFRSDGAEKQARASDRIRSAAERWVYPVYERLESARTTAEAATAEAVGRAHDF